MASKQQLKVKSSIVDVNNYLNGIFMPFDSLNSEFSSGFRLIDNFSNHFSFYQANCKYKERKMAYICKINNIFSNTSLDPKFVVVILDTSIRNNIATSISYLLLMKSEREFIMLSTLL